MNTSFNPIIEPDSYQYPPLSLLDCSIESTPYIDFQEYEENRQKIITVFTKWDIGIISIKVTVGYAISLYEIKPTADVKMKSIQNLTYEIASSFKVKGVRVLAPIPGKNTIGVEIPNKKQCVVSMASVINSKTYQTNKMEQPCVLGKTPSNKVFMIDLAKAPHILVGGAPGMGLQVGLNTIITSLLYTKHPTELKLVLIDPKKIEFCNYEPIAKQFLATLPDKDSPIVNDTNNSLRTLKAIDKLMCERYDMLRTAKARNVKEYNNLYKSGKLKSAEGYVYMPYYVTVVNHIGDLLMIYGKEIELALCRIAQLSRAVGIHLVVSTERPSFQIISGIIKANFPARIAFRVRSVPESVAIIDTPDACYLTGRGDMLFSQGLGPVRVQCAFVGGQDVKNISKHISSQQKNSEMTYLPDVPYEEDRAARLDGTDMNHLDPYFREAAELIVETKVESTSLLQRKFSIGYNRAGRLMDQLEKAGIIGPYKGAKPRDVLVSESSKLKNILESLKV